MSKVLVTESHLSDIADAIRAKNGLETEYRPGDMAAAIAAIPSGGITPTGTISITQNGTVDVTNYASASVNVSGGGGGGYLRYEIKTHNTGSNNASLYANLYKVVGGASALLQSMDISFLPFYQHKYEYLDVYGAVRIRYAAPTWSIEALTDITDISTGTAYHNGDSLASWGYTVVEEHNYKEVL